MGLNWLMETLLSQLMEQLGRETLICVEGRLLKMP